MPLFLLALGGLIFAAMVIGGNPEEGVGSFAVMAVAAAMFWFGGRSETLRGLGGPGRDERWSMIDLRATASRGVALLIVLSGSVAVGARAGRGRRSVRPDHGDRRLELHRRRGVPALALVAIPAETQEARGRRASRSG
jgi:hypothetical protein